MAAQRSRTSRTTDGVVTNSRSSRSALRAPPSMCSMRCARLRLLQSGGQLRIPRFGFANRAFGDALDGVRVVQKGGADHDKLAGQGKALGFGDPHGGAENHELVLDAVVVRGPPGQPALETIAAAMASATGRSSARSAGSLHQVETAPGHRLRWAAVCGRGQDRLSPDYQFLATRTLSTYCAASSG